jgi:hypothetical protein
LAKTYGQLPSYVRDNATTYDVKVMDLMLSWEEQASNERNGVKQQPKLSQAEMLDMIKKARGE